MIKAEFPLRRAIVGWISLLYGLCCWASTFFFPTSGYDNYSLPTVLFLIAWLIFLLFSSVSKTLRITKRYSLGIIFTALVSLFIAIWFYMLSPDQAKPLQIQSSTAMILGILYLIWIVLWVIVDVMDIFNAPKASEKDDDL